MIRGPNSRYRWSPYQLDWDLESFSLELKPEMLFSGDFRHFELDSVTFDRLGAQELNFVDPLPRCCLVHVSRTPVTSLIMKVSEPWYVVDSGGRYRCCLIFMLLYGSLVASLEFSYLFCWCLIAFGSMSPCYKVPNFTSTTPLTNMETLSRSKNNLSGSWIVLSDLTLPFAARVCGLSL